MLYSLQLASVNPTHVKNSQYPPKIWLVKKVPSYDHQVARLDTKLVHQDNLVVGSNIARIHRQSITRSSSPKQDNAPSQSSPMDLVSFFWIAKRSKKMTLKNPYHEKYLQQLRERGQHVPTLKSSTIAKFREIIFGLFFWEASYWYQNIHSPMGQRANIDQLSTFDTQKILWGQKYRACDAKCSLLSYHKLGVWVGTFVICYSTLCVHLPRAIPI